MRPTLPIIGSIFLIALLSWASRSKEVLSAPPEAIGPYLNGIFPDRTPAAGGSWELEDVLPGQTLYGPTRIIPFGETGDILVLGLRGEVWRVDLADQFVDRVLDLRDRAFKLGDGGTVGIALHPEFGNPAEPDKQHIFIYYRTKPDPDAWDEIGYNVLAKYHWDESSGTFDEASEEILFRQYDRFTWHNGGGLFFGDDGFLYVSVGDEGADQFQLVSTQRLDGGFFSGIMRIDVDNDPSRSHPIIRQPLANGTPPNGWPNTFSQGYSIPNDNPWLAPDGEHLEEFFAVGLRSPYGMTYDQVTGEIWVADVGAAFMEEISRVSMGDNLQWPWFEGTRPYEDYVQPTEIIGQSRDPYLGVDRAYGSCIIGGSVYRGTTFTELRGKYLFADFVSNKLMAVESNLADNEAEVEVLIEDIRNRHETVPQGAGITSVAALPDGSILLAVIGNRMSSTPGKLYRLRRAGATPDPPARLSEIGAFTSLSTLTPTPGLIPYQTASQLWSDRAVKQRWMAVPNDGSYDTPNETIDFERSSEWDFPPGTVFVKHFELPTQLDVPSQTKRLETRFFIVGEEQSYGLSYHWNEEGNEAFLASGSDFREFEVFDESGDLAFVQRWEYPSRGQCMTCHTAPAKHVLGVKTHQLNTPFYYPELGREVNQLEYLADMGLFGDRIGNTEVMPRAVAIDDENTDLGVRVRSYLDANCASCHRPGGLPTVSMDLRFNTPLFLSNIISAPNQSNASDPDGLIVSPGFHAHSELWIRDNSSESNRMPPLGRNLVDQYYVDRLAEWIDGMPTDFTSGADRNYVYPNPTSDWINIRIRDDWALPVHLNIYAIDGRIIHQTEMEYVSDYLDLSVLPAGTYVMELNTKDGQREVQRIVLR